STRVAFENTVAPATMGCGLWWLTGQYRWPESRLPVFFVVHALLAVVFAGLWTLWMLFTVGALGGGRMSRDVLLHAAIPWHIVMGLLLYGVIAGSAYGAR